MFRLLGFVVLMLGVGFILFQYDFALRESNAAAGIPAVFAMFDYSPPSVLASLTLIVVGAYAMFRNNIVYADYDDYDY